jgi:hypothetical protein
MDEGNLTVIEHHRSHLRPHDRTIMSTDGQFSKLTSDDISALTGFFHHVDADGDGFVTVEEIRAACAVDIDGNGVIESTEIDTGAFPWLQDLPAQDTNGDQKLSLMELLKYNDDAAAASTTT